MNESQVYFHLYVRLTPQEPTPQNSQTHSNNSPSVADELFQCFIILLGWRLKG